MTNRVGWRLGCESVFEDAADAVRAPDVWCAGGSQRARGRGEGMLMFAQYMASQGYNIVPTTKLQRYVKGIDLRSAVEDNVAFKLSFGLTFALASLASF